MKLAAKLFAFLALAWAHQAQATPFPSPAPGLMGPDVDGDGYFSQATGLKLGIEIVDLANFEFGFYFEGNSGSLYSVFDTLDANPDPGGPGSVDQVALISFADGFVIDIDDDPDTLQTDFTAEVGNTADIGFYLSVGGATLFSDPLLNGGSDRFGAFPLLDPNTPAGSFANVFFGDTAPTPLYIVSVVEVGVPVSEPATLLLFGSGLLLAGFARRRQTDA